MSDQVPPSSLQGRLYDKLPPDLAAAYRAASEHTFVGYSLWGFSMMATTGRRPLGADFASPLVGRVLEFFLPRRDRRRDIDPVLHRLILASQGAPFKESSAHEAAIAFADGVLNEMWQAVDLLGWINGQADESIPYPVALIQSKIMMACSAVAREKWPDGYELMTALDVEIVQAAANGQPVGFVGPNDADNKKEPSVPAYWYHGGMSYSFDRVHQRLVAKAEHQILQAFLKEPFAKSTNQLEQIVSNPSAVITSIEGKLGVGPISRSVARGAGYNITVKSVE